MQMRLQASAEGKLGLVNSYLRCGLFLLEKSQTAPLAILVAGRVFQEYSLPWNWAIPIRTVASYSGVIGVGSVCMVLIAPSGSGPFPATLGATLLWPPNHGHKISNKEEVGNRGHILRSESFTKLFWVLSVKEEVILTCNTQCNAAFSLQSISAWGKSTGGKVRLPWYAILIWTDSVELEGLSSTQLYILSLSTNVIHLLGAGDIPERQLISRWQVSLPLKHMGVSGSGL